MSPAHARTISFPFLFPYFLLQSFLCFVLPLASFFSPLSFHFNFSLSSSFHLSSVPFLPFLIFFSPPLLSSPLSSPVFSTHYLSFNHLLSLSPGPASPLLLLSLHPLITPLASPNVAIVVLNWTWQNLLLPNWDWASRRMHQCSGLLLSDATRSCISMQTSAVAQQSHLQLGEMALCDTKTCLLSTKVPCKQDACVLIAPDSF